MLHSQLYGRDKDLCKHISFSDIESVNGVDKICKRLHKKDALSVNSNGYGDFMALLSTKRSSNENYPNFESRFTAAVSKLNSHAANTLPESLTAFMPMANSSIDSNQRISILVAATAQSSELISSTASEELLKSVKYDLIVSILRQCDKAKPEHGSDAIRVNNANFPKRFYKGRKYTPEELAEFKARSRCRVSTKWGH